MIFEFSNSSEDIWQGQLTGEVGKEDSYEHKTFDEKMLLNSTWCLTVSSRVC